MRLAMKKSATSPGSSTLHEPSVSLPVEGDCDAPVVPAFTEAELVYTTRWFLADAAIAGAFAVVQTWFMAFL